MPTTRTTGKSIITTGKDKKKDRDESGYYVFYYIPRDFRAQAMSDCPPAKSIPFAQREAAPPLPELAPRAHGKTRDAFPKESRQDRSLAGQRQRAILEKELSTEQELLDLAKRELAEEQRRLSAQGSGAFPERLRAYKESVELHENNVAAIRRELAALARRL